MKKTIWVAKARMAEKPGKLVWADLKTFDNPAEADEWLCEYIRSRHLPATDFNLVRREVEV